MVNLGTRLIVRSREMARTEGGYSEGDRYTTEDGKTYELYHYDPEDNRENWVEVRPTLGEKTI
jgi:hypothetical protein